MFKNNLFCWVFLVVVGFFVVFCGIFLFGFLFCFEVFFVLGFFCYPAEPKQP